MSEVENKVVKRNGKYQDISYDKITKRIRMLCVEPTPLTHIDIHRIVKKVIEGLVPGIRTSELDESAAAIAAALAIEHPEYDTLAARIAVSNYHKNNICYLSARYGVADIQRHLYYWTARALSENRAPSGEPAPLLAPRLMDFISANRDALEHLLQYEEDYQYTYAGFCALRQNYLLTVMDGGLRVPIERPQHLLMRVTLGIHLPHPDDRYEMYVDTENILKELDQTNLWPSTSDPAAWHKALMTNHPNPDAAITLLQASTHLRADLADNSTTISPRLWTTITNCYNLLRKRMFIHGTTTLFHAGTLHPQLSSCYLVAMPEDSLSGIAHYWDIIAQISKGAGGIGSHLHNIRANGSFIKGTNGQSNGLVPLLRVVNEISQYVDQGGNKRAGSHAIYLEPWHADIEDFLQLKKAHGNTKERATALFYALWLPDEFFRVLRKERELFEKGESFELWYLMDPAVCPGLSEVYDRAVSSIWVETANDEFAFTQLYRKYIAAGRYVRRISAYALWMRVLDIIIETGVPYMKSKDACNRKSNHQHLGTIKSSNLCTEIDEYSDAKEVAVCNLASINLVKFVRDNSIGEDRIDWPLLRQVVRVCVENINKIIDINAYPVPEARLSNLRHRPIGIGVQGLADLFLALRLPFDSPDASRLNFYLFEHIYFYALEASVDLSKVEGSYASFVDSPASKGELAIDYWPHKYPLSLDWESLRLAIRRYGLRNSLVIALMPTATTSTILGSNPCFEPLNGLVYKLNNKSNSDHVIVNARLVEDLLARDLWTPAIRNALIAGDGGIQNIDVPSDLKELYKTAFDIDPHVQVDLCLDRSPFVDQSQSMNLFISVPTRVTLTRLYFYLWRAGAKTLSYYVRRKAVMDAQKTQVCVLNADCKGCGS